MIDHLLRFPNEAAAIVACSQFRPAEGWDTSQVVPGCRVYIVTGTSTDPETGAPVEVREYLPYWYLWVALPALDEALTAMPECMIAADREAAGRGEPYALFSRIPAENLPSYFVEPVIAGSRYPFGA